MRIVSPWFWVGYWLLECVIAGSAMVLTQLPDFVPQPLMPWVIQNSQMVGGQWLVVVLIACAILINSARGRFEVRMIHRPRPEDRYVPNYDLPRPVQVEYLLFIQFAAAITFVATNIWLSQIRTQTEGDYSWLVITFVCGLPVLRVVIYYASARFAAFIRACVETVHNLNVLMAYLILRGEIAYKEFVDKAIGAALVAVRGIRFPKISIVKMAIWVVFVAAIALP
jgi:hypothetical protein